MSSAAKIGIFMTVILVILGYFIVRVEDVAFGGEPTKTVEAVFESIAGLDEGSAVRVAGVRVGRVAKIELLPDGRAKVTLEIDEDVPLRRGATARVASMGLLGEQYVELEPGPPAAPPLPEDAVLAGADTPSIDDLTNQLASIADDVKAITTSLRAAMAGPEGTQRLEEIVTNIHDVTFRLRSILENNEANINATAENLRFITDELRVEIPRIAESIDRVANSIGGTVGENREDIRVIVDNLRTLSSDLKTTTANLNSITGQVSAGEGTVGKLIYSDEAHDTLVSALGSIDEGVGELRDVLGRVNRLGLQVGLDGWWLSEVPDAQFEGNGRFTLGATIVPNIERNMFLHVGATQDARGDRNEKVKVTTRIENGVESTVVERQVKWDKEFLISAQVGWEFDDLRVRGGLIDSYGGVGADWRATERIQVSGEIFDFGSEFADYPRFRLIGRWRLREERENAPAIWLNTGVEDVLNEPAFMFGAGVQWDDEDLKYLLGSVPIPSN
ncbi:MAG: MlaD family protein [Thermoanaerobaculia bacterium]